MAVADLRLDLYEARRRFGVRCGDCGSPMVLLISTKYGRPFWGCSKFPFCRGTLSAHPDGAPMGHPGNAETRKMRIHAHAEFDHAWKARGMTREQAYAWLEEIMGKPRSAAHISKFSANECRHLIRVVQIAEAVRKALEESAEST